MSQEKEIRNLHPLLSQVAALIVMGLAEHVEAAIRAMVADLGKQDSQRTEQKENA